MAIQRTNDVHVKLLKGWRGHLAGKVITVPSSLRALLIRHGIAELMSQVVETASIDPPRRPRMKKARKNVRRLD